MQTDTTVPFPRITRDPAVVGGEGHVSAVAVTVGMILVNLGDGVAFDEVLAAYAYL